MIIPHSKIEDIRVLLGKTRCGRCKYFIVTSGDKFLTKGRYICTVESGITHNLQNIKTTTSPLFAIFCSDFEPKDGNWSSLDLMMKKGCEKCGRVFTWYRIIKCESFKNEIVGLWIQCTQNGCGHITYYGDRSDNKVQFT